MIGLFRFGIAYANTKPSGQWPEGLTVQLGLWPNTGEGGPVNDLLGLTIVNPLSFELPPEDRLLRDGFP